MRFLLIAIVLLSSLPCDCTGLCGQSNNPPPLPGLSPGLTNDAPVRGASPSSSGGGCQNDVNIVVVQGGSACGGSPEPVQAQAPSSSSPLGGASPAPAPVSPPEPASSPSPSGSASSAPVQAGGSQSTMMVHATFYGKDDAGGLAAYTQKAPGGDGSYANPLTMAGDPAWSWLPKGAILYSKTLQRYFINQDQCNACIGTSNPARMDFWVGSSPGDVPCAQQLIAINKPTQDTGTTPIVLNPPNNLPTIAGPMWDGSTCNMPPQPYPTS